MADGNVHYVMYVNLQDGNKDVYYIGDDPVVTFDENHVYLKTKSVETTYNLADVVDYRFQNAEETSVEKLKIEEKNTRYSVEYVDNKTVIIRGVKQGKGVNVFSVNGQKEKADMSSSNNEVTISLENLNNGLHIINIGNEFSVKVIKK